MELGQLVESSESSPDPLGQPDLSSPSYLGSSSVKNRYWGADGRSRSRSRSRLGRRKSGGRTVGTGTVANTPALRRFKIIVTEPDTDRNTVDGIEEGSVALEDQILSQQEFSDSDSDNGSGGFHIFAPQDSPDLRPQSSAQRGRQESPGQTYPRQRRGQQDLVQSGEGDEQDRTAEEGVGHREEQEREVANMDDPFVRDESSPEQARPITHVRATSAATKTTTVPLKTGEETPKRRKKRRTLTPKRRRTTPLARRVVEPVLEPEDEVQDVALVGEEEDEELVAAQTSPTPRKTATGRTSHIPNGINGPIVYPDLEPHLQQTDRQMAPGASPGKRRRIVSDGESSDAGVFVRPTISMSERLGTQSAIVGSMSPVKASPMKAQQQQRGTVNGDYNGAAVTARTVDPTDEHEEFDSILESEDFTMVSLSSIPSGQQLRSLTRGGRPGPSGLGPGPVKAPSRYSPRAAVSSTQALVQSRTPAARAPSAAEAAVPAQNQYRSPSQLRSRNQPPTTPHGDGTGLLAGFSPATRRELRAGLRLGQELAKRSVEAKRQQTEPTQQEDLLTGEPTELPIEDATTDVFADLAAAESSHVSTSSIGDRIRRAGELIEPQQAKLRESLRERPHAASTAAAASRTPPRVRANQLPSPEQSDEHDISNGVGGPANGFGRDEMSWRYDTPAKSRLGLPTSAAARRSVQRSVQKPVEVPVQKPMQEPAQKSMQGSTQRQLQLSSPVQQEERPVVHVPSQRQEEENEEEHEEEVVEEEFGEAAEDEAIAEGIDEEVEDEIDGVDEAEEIEEEALPLVGTPTKSTANRNANAYADYEEDVIYDDDGFDAPSSPDKQLFLEQAAAELEASRLTQATANATAEDAVEISSNDSEEDSSSDDEVPPELSDATKSILADATFDIWQTEAEEASALSRTARSRVGNSSVVNGQSVMNDEAQYQDGQDEQESESETQDDAEPGFVIHEDGEAQVNGELEGLEDAEPLGHDYDDAAGDENDESNETSFYAEDEPVEVKEEPIPASEQEDVEMQDVEMEDVGDVSDELEEGVELDNDEVEVEESLENDLEDDVEESVEDDVLEEEEGEEEEEEEIEDEPSADTQLLRHPRSQHSGETPSSPPAVHQPSSPPHPPPAPLSQPLNPPKAVPSQSLNSPKPLPPQPVVASLSQKYPHPVDQELYPPRRGKLPSLWRRQSSDPIVYSDEPELPPAEHESEFRVSSMLGKRQRTWVTPEARKKSRFDDADFSVLSEFDNRGSREGSGRGRSRLVAAAGPPSSPLKRVRFESEDPENPYLPTTPVVRSVQRIVEEDEEEEEEDEEEEYETSQEVSASFEEEEELSHDMDGEPVRIMWEAKPSPEQRQRHRQGQSQRQGAVTQPAKKQGSWLSGLLPSWFKAPKEPIFRFSLPNLPQWRGSASAEEQEESELSEEQDDNQDAVPRTPSSAANSSPASSRRSRSSNASASPSQSQSQSQSQSYSQSNSQPHSQQHQHQNSSPSPLPSHRQRHRQTSSSASTFPQTPPNPNAYTPAPPPPSFSTTHYAELKRLYTLAKERPFPIPRGDRAVMSLLGWEISRLGWKKRVNSWELGVIAAFLEVVKSGELNGLGGDEGGNEDEGRVLPTPEQVARRLFSIWAVEVQRGETGLGRATAGKFSTAYVGQREAVLARARRRKSLAAS